MNRVRSMKFLHTSDIHLGATFDVLGDKASEQREQLKTTFSKVVDLALARDVDLFLIAGDLFDSNNPSPSLIDFVSRIFTRLTDHGIKICLIPGNHDYALIDRKSLGKEFLDREKEGVFIFTDPDGSKVEFQELNTEVYARANTINKSSKSPLVVVDSSFSGFQILMAHGGVVGQAKKPEWPIQPRDIESCGADYVALGDWHSWREESQGKVIAYYSGSPEMISISQSGAGYVIVGEYTNGSLSLEPIRVGQRTAEELSFHVGDIKNVDDMKQRIIERGNPDLALTVRLEGVGIHAIDSASLEKELASHFWRLKILDETHPVADDQDLEGYPSLLASGQLVAIFKEKIKGATNEEERSLYEEALKLGLAALNDPDVIA